MKKAGTNEIKRGQALSFRLPSDTPEHLLKELQRLKETEKRNFSSKIAEFVLQGVGNSYSREKETVTIPLPKSLTKIQRDWLKHEHSEALLGSIVYQLIADPIRSTSLLASLNSKSLDLDEALYLQEDVLADHTAAAVIDEEEGLPDETAVKANVEDELDAFDWTQMKQVDEPIAEEDDEDEDDLLGGFLSSMNK
ncbi:hypothetical protein [Neobacillus mesonae]|uniref:hypothetical protein n=1 Tax=Neobacillus mesonae TaxID=1193713 RepID=UPI00203BFEEC|nr:hypothetical protein [Neobacillus mesonae]MCM3567090.1 hypothetical protein [Neobacillus mesonae]